MNRLLRCVASVTVPIVVALGLAVASLSIRRPAGPRQLSVAGHVPITLEDAGIELGPPFGTPTVRVIGDYECSACESLEHTIGEKLKALATEGRIRYQLVQAPLPAHRRAPKAATALFCAERQGAPWDMHRLLVRGRPEWGWGDDPVRSFERYAGELGLATAEFAECLESTDARRRLERDRAAAAAIGATRLPTIFIDSTLVVPSRSFSEVLSVLETRLTHGTAAPGPVGDVGERAVSTDHGTARVQR